MADSVAGPTGSKDARLNKLIQKLHHRLPDVRERALSNLLFKVQHGLVSVYEFAADEQACTGLCGIITGGGSTRAKALEILTLVAEEAPARPLLLQSDLEAALTESIIKFEGEKENAPSPGEMKKAQHIMALLQTGTIKIDDQLSHPSGPAADIDGPAAEPDIPLRPQVPATAAPHEGWCFPHVHLRTADTQLLHECEMQLGASAHTGHTRACHMLRNLVLPNLPAEVLLQKASYIQLLLRHARQAAEAISEGKQEHSRLNEFIFTIRDLLAQLRRSLTRHLDDDMKLSSTLQATSTQQLAVASGWRFVQGMRPEASTRSLSLSGAAMLVLEGVLSMSLLCESFLGAQMDIACQCLQLLAEPFPMRFSTSGEIERSHTTCLRFQQAFELLAALPTHQRASDVLELVVLASDCAASSGCDLTHLDNGVADAVRLPTTLVDMIALHICRSSKSSPQQVASLRTLLRRVDQSIWSKVGQANDLLRHREEVADLMGTQVAGNPEMDPLVAAVVMHRESWDANSPDVAEALSSRIRLLRRALGSSGRGPSPLSLAEAPEQQLEWLCRHVLICTALENLGKDSDSDGEYDATQELSRILSTAHPVAGIRRCMLATMKRAVTGGLIDMPTGPHWNADMMRSVVLHSRIIFQQLLCAGCEDPQCEEPVRHIMTQVAEHAFTSDSMPEHMAKSIPTLVLLQVEVQSLMDAFPVQMQLHFTLLTMCHRNKHVRLRAARRAQNLFSESELADAWSDALLQQGISGHTDPFAAAEGVSTTQLDVEITGPDFGGHSRAELQNVISLVGSDTLPDTIWTSAARQCTSMLLHYRSDLDDFEKQLGATVPGLLASAWRAMRDCQDLTRLRTTMRLLVVLVCKFEVVAQCAMGWIAKLLNGIYHPDSATRHVFKQFMLVIGFHPARFGILRTGVATISVLDNGVPHLSLPAALLESCDLAIFQRRIQVEPTTVDSSEAVGVDIDYSEVRLYAQQIIAGDSDTVGQTQSPVLSSVAEALESLSRAKSHRECKLALAALLLALGDNAYARDTAQVGWWSCLSKFFDVYPSIEADWDIFALVSEVLVCLIQGKSTPVKSLAFTAQVCEDMFVPIMGPLVQQMTQHVGAQATGVHSTPCRYRSQLLWLDLLVATLNRGASDSQCPWISALAENEQVVSLLLGMCSPTSWHVSTFPLIRSALKALELVTRIHSRTRSLWLTTNAPALAHLCSTLWIDASSAWKSSFLGVGIIRPALAIMNHVIRATPVVQIMENDLLEKLALWLKKCYAIDDATIRAAVMHMLIAVLRSCNDKDIDASVRFAWRVMVRAPFPVDGTPDGLRRLLLHFNDQANMQSAVPLLRAAAVHAASVCYKLLCGITCKSQTSTLRERHKLERTLKSLSQESQATMSPAIFHAGAELLHLLLSVVPSASTVAEAKEQVDGALVSWVPGALAVFKAADGGGRALIPTHVQSASLSGSGSEWSLARTCSCSDLVQRICSSSWRMMHCNRIHVARSYLLHVTHSSCWSQTRSSARVTPYSNQVRILSSQVVQSGLDHFRPKRDDGHSQSAALSPAALHVYIQETNMLQIMIRCGKLTPSFEVTTLLVTGVLAGLQRSHTSIDLVCALFRLLHVMIQDHAWKNHTREVLQHPIESDTAKTRLEVMMDFIMDGFETHTATSALCVQGLLAALFSICPQSLEAFMDGEGLQKVAAAVTPHSLGSKHRDMQLTAHTFNFLADVARLQPDVQSDAVFADLISAAEEHLGALCKQLRKNVLSKPGFQILLAILNMLARCPVPLNEHLKRQSGALFAERRGRRRFPWRRSEVASSHASSTPIDMNQPLQPLRFKSRLLKLLSHVLTRRLERGLCRAAMPALTSIFANMTREENLLVALERSGLLRNLFICVKRCSVVGEHQAAKAGSAASDVLLLLAYLTQAPSLASHSICMSGAVETIAHLSQRLGGSNTQLHALMLLRNLAFVEAHKYRFFTHQFLISQLVSLLDQSEIRVAASATLVLWALVYNYRRAAAELRKAGLHEQLAQIGARLETCEGELLTEARRGVHILSELLQPTSTAQQLATNAVP